MVGEPLALAKRKIVVDVDDRALPDIVAGLAPLVLDRDECGLLVSANVPAQQICGVIERVAPGIAGHKGEAAGVALLHHSLQ